jgi:hypothetical protein
MQEVSVFAPPRDVTMADTFVDRLERWIAVVEEHLEEDEQIRLVVPLPNGKELLVQHIGYHNPTLIALRGVLTDSEMVCDLLVHQCSVQLLCSIEKVGESESRRKIGFIREKAE